MRSIFFQAVPLTSTWKLAFAGGICSINLCRLVYAMGGHDSFTDTMIHALSKTITGLKMNKYWKIGIKEGISSSPSSLPWVDIPAICVERPQFPLDRLLQAWSCRCFNLNGSVCSAVITSVLITSPLSRKSYSLSIELCYMRLKSCCFK